MCALSVMETKLTSGNDFIVDLLVLRSEKESKYDKRTLFWGSPWSLDLSLSLSPTKDAYMRSSKLL